MKIAVVTRLLTKRDMNVDTGHLKLLQINNKKGNSESR